MLGTFAQNFERTAAYKTINVQILCLSLPGAAAAIEGLARDYTTRAEEVCIVCSDQVCAKGYYPTTAA